MTLRKYFIGGSGPFYYDDEEEYLPAADYLNSPEDYDEEIDPNTGLPVVVTKKTIRTEGVIKAEGAAAKIIADNAPGTDNEVLRLADLSGGIGNITVPSGFMLVFLNANPAGPHAEFKMIGNTLYLFIGGRRVASWDAP